MSDNLFDIYKKPDNYYSGNREEMYKFIPPGIGTVLEVGCGDGDFGQNLKLKRSVELWGIELFPESAEKAKNRLDKVLVGDFEKGEIHLPDNYFDCIIFNDVLEHFRYPWIVLRGMEKCLKKDGYIVASIPNVRYYENIKNLLINKKWEYTDQGVLDKTHLRFFTCKSIKEMFKDCGYSVITIEGIRGKNFRWKFGILNALLLNSLDDMRYQQFACVARK